MKQKTLISSVTSENLIENALKHGLHSFDQVTCSIKA